MSIGMAASWFELEWAEAQIRAGKPGLAMKKALAVHTHFEDFVEDQFDFHTYCMRKVRFSSCSALQLVMKVPRIRYAKSPRSLRFDRSPLVKSCSRNYR